jgi:hypothetical protein
MILYPLLHVPQFLPCYDSQGSHLCSSTLPTLLGTWCQRGRSKCIRESSVKGRSVSIAYLKGRKSHQSFLLSPLLLKKESYLPGGVIQREDDMQIQRGENFLLCFLEGRNTWYLSFGFTIGIFIWSQILLFSSNPMIWKYIWFRGRGIEYLTESKSSRFYWKSFSFGDMSAISSQCSLCDTHYTCHPNLGILDDSCIWLKKNSCVI